MIALLLTLLACSPAPAPAARPAAAPPFDLSERSKVKTVEAGVLREILPAGPYRYLRYTLPSGEDRWLATLPARPLPALGSAIEAVRFSERTDFHSARLQRDFTTLGFGYLRDPSPPSPHTELQ